MDEVNRVTDTYRVTEDDVIFITAESLPASSEVFLGVHIYLREEIDVERITVQWIGGKHFVHLDADWHPDNIFCRSLIDLGRKYAYALTVVDEYLQEALMARDFPDANKTPGEDCTLRDVQRWFEFFRYMPDDHPYYPDARWLDGVIRARHTDLITKEKDGGYVYVVRAVTPDNYYKIGLSKDPIKRIETLGVKLPFPIEVIHLIPADNRYKAEKLLHEKFAEFRVDGEWFALTEKHISQIKNMDRVIYGVKESF